MAPHGILLIPNFTSKCYVWKDWSRASLSEFRSVSFSYTFKGIVATRMVMSRIFDPLVHVVNGYWDISYNSTLKDNFHTLNL